MKIKNYRQNLLVTFLVGSLATLTPSAFAEIDSDDNEVVRLKLQNLIDFDAPLYKTTWPGAHNGYASYQWDAGIYTDVNQWYAPSKLFNRGITLTEYDAYPKSSTDSTPELCHFTYAVSVTNDGVTITKTGENDDCAWVSGATLGQGLEELRDYIDDNPNTVLMLKLEVYDNKTHDNFRNKVGNKIETKLEGYVFKPSDWGYADGDCASLPVQHLSKRDVLAAGRNIIIMTQIPTNADDDANGDLCDYHDESGASSYREWVWIGVDENDSDGNRYQNQALCQNNTRCQGENQDFESHYTLKNMGVLLDASTEYDGKVKSSRTGDAVIETAESGAQMLELAMVEANSTKMGISNAPEIKDYIWSWDNTRSEPSGSGKCAYTYDGKISDGACINNKKHACVDANRKNWSLSANNGPWSDGFSACASLNLFYAMPYNAVENAKLQKDIGSTEAWVNYFEATDGLWVANKSADDYWAYYSYTTSARGNDSSGSAFDDEDVVNKKMLLPNYNVKTIKLTAGTSTYLDSITTCYEYGQTISHATATSDYDCQTHGKNGSGGTSASLTLDTVDGEYINYMQTCLGSDGDRVTYLRLGTNKGNSVEIGKCITDSYSTTGGAIIGFHGRDKNVIYSLGSYKVNSEIAVQAYEATDWLNRDTKISNGDNETISGHQNDGTISCGTSELAGYVARVSNTKLDSSLTGQVFETTNGFACWNSFNGGGNGVITCDDYEVRYFFKQSGCVN